MITKLSYAAAKKEVESFGYYTRGEGMLSGDVCEVLKSLDIKVIRSLHSGKGIKLSSLTRGLYIVSTCSHFVVIENGVVFDPAKKGMTLLFGENITHAAAATGYEVESLIECEVHDFKG